MFGIITGSGFYDIAELANRSVTPIDTPYGKARSAWKLEDETMRLEAVVPPNSGAVLRLTEGAVVKENGTAKELRVSGGNVLLDLAPGEHRFEITGY